MHMQNMMSALSAVSHVRMELKIESSNRPSDNKPDDFMVPLGKTKLEMSNQLSDLKQRTADIILKTMTELQGRLDRLRKLQTELGKTLSTNDELRKRFEAALKTTGKELETLIGASNKPVGAMQVVASVGKEVSSLNVELGKMRNSVQESALTIEEDVIITAAASAKTGRGNCDEMSSLAFLYLRKSGVKPIDLVETGANTKDDIHQFVVIGRKNTEALSEPAKWTEAVVCDAWDQSVCSGDALPTKLAGLGYPSTTLYLRLRDQ